MKDINPAITTFLADQSNLGINTFGTSLEFSHAIAAVYGSPSYNAYLTDESRQVLGVLSAAQKKPLRKKHWLSVPHATNANILVSGTFDEQNERRQALLNAFFAENPGAVLTERHLEQLPCADTFSGEVHFILPLSDSPDSFKKGVGNKIRNQVKKAEKNGLVFVKELALSDFFSVYSRVSGGLGTPVQPMSFFSALQREFANDFDCVGVRDASGQCVAAAVLLQTPHFTFNPFAGSLTEARKLNANMFLYYSMLLLSVSHNRKYFDFGRSSLPSSTAQFKRQWGAVPFRIKSIRYTSSNLEGATADHPKAGRLMKILSFFWKILPVNFQVRLSHRARLHLE